MKCAICKHGDTQPGTTTVTLERSGCTILIKDVPADVCDNCGEYYVDDDIARNLFARAESAVQAGSELQVIRYAA